MAGTYSNWTLEHAVYASNAWVGLTDFVATIKTLLALDVTKAAARADLCHRVSTMGTVGFVRKNVRFPEQDASGDVIYVFLGDSVLSGFIDKVMTSCTVATGERQDMPASSGGHPRAAVVGESSSSAQSQLQALQTSAYAIRVNLTALLNAINSRPFSGVYNRDRFEEHTRLVWD
nr:coat protein [Wheat stripe mosaic virus]